MNDHRIGGVVPEKYDPYQPRKARERAQLEHEIMSPSVPKNDREWWAMEEIEALRKIEAAASQVLSECDGDFSPSLGSVAKLADAVHGAWKRKQPSS